MCSDPSKAPLEFKFVEGRPATGETYNSAVRAHVLKKHLALRKSQSKKRRQRNHSPEPNEKDTSDQLVTNRELEETVNQDENKLIYLPRQRQATFNFFEQNTADPFQTFARPINNFEKLLIENFLDPNYQWTRGSNFKAKFMPSKHIFFPLNISDPLTIDVMISYGASSLTSSENSSESQSLVLLCRNKAITSINERLQHESREPSIPLVIAIAGSIITVLETERADLTNFFESPLVRIHLKGLRSLIGSSVGWTRIKSLSMPATWLVFWVDMHLSGMILNDFTQASSWTSVNNVPNLQTVTSLTLGTMELVYIYKEFHAAANSRWSSPEATKHQALEPIWLFQPFGAAYPILRREKSSKISRLVPLIFINLLLLKTQHLSSEEKSVLYYTFRRSMSDLGVEHSPTLETLIWALMTDTRGPALSDILMLECTMRLVHETTNMMSAELTIFADILCDFILLFQEEAVLGKDNWWTPEEFKNIISKPRVVAFGRS